MSAASDDVIEELVHQFTDPFAFYRELIQNSIDAGSTRVEVVLAFEPAAGEGTMTARVSDWGEGMDRRIIDQYLLTKFRSSKEGDLTKIGKFGIGFLSVFSSAPDLVVVETGRNGEDWRLLFHPDRTYELLRSPEPVEGTHVSVHKAMPASAYRTFARKSAEAVAKWCRHSEVEVAFAAGGGDGSAPPPAAVVRQPFTVDAPCQVEERGPLGWIVAGYARADPPPVGFYNRGLTLMETAEPLVPTVTFKVMSDHLEHTLTRDNVIRDRRFDKVVAAVAALEKGALRERLGPELRAAAEDPARAADHLVLFHLALARLPWSQVWLPLLGGGATTLRSLEERPEGLVVAAKPSRVTAALRGRAIPVLPRGEAADAAGQKIRKTLVDADAAFSLAETRADEPSAFFSALRSALAEAGARTTRIAVAQLHGAGSERTHVLAAEEGSPEPSATALASPFDRGAPTVLCLSAAHPHVVAALKVAEASPALAALLCARLLAVGAGALGHAADRRLTDSALAT